MEIVIKLGLNLKDMTQNNMVIQILMDVTVVDGMMRTIMEFGMKVKALMVTIM